MKRVLAIGVLVVVLVSLAYIVGVWTGKYSDWLNVNEPPMPTVTVNGNSVAVFRGSYSWSKKPPLFGAVESVSIDMLAPKDYIQMNNVKPTVVSPGSRIDSGFDKAYQMSLRELTLRVQSQQDHMQMDMYMIPKEKGTYIYEILTRWRAEQGHAMYFFVLEVN